MPLRASLNATVTKLSGGPSATFVSPWFNNGQNTFPAQQQGPSGGVQIDGTVTWGVSPNISGGIPTLQTARVDKNVPGVAANLPSMATFNHSPAFCADGASIGFQGSLPIVSPDLPGGYSGINTASHFYWGFTDDPWYGTVNGGTLTDAAFNSQGFVSQPIFYGNVTINARADFVSRELYRGTGDGGHTPTIAQHVGLFIEPYAAATQNIGVWIDDNTTGVEPGASSTWGIYNRRSQYTGGDVQVQGTVTIRPAAATYTASQVDYGNGGGTATFSTTASMQHFFMEDKGTDLWSVAPNAIGQYIGVYIHPTIINASSLSADFGSISAVSVAPTITVDTATGRALTALVAFTSASTVSRANLGTITSGITQGYSDKLTLNAPGSTITTNTSFKSDLTVTAGTISTRYGVQVNDATNSGTITSQVGLYVASLTAGGTNHGIQNLSDTVLGSSGQLIIDTSGNINAAAGLALQATAFGTKTSNFEICDVAVGTTMTINASALIYRGINLSPTITWQTGPGVTGVNTGLNINTTYQGNTGATDTFANGIISGINIADVLKTQDTNSRTLLLYNTITAGGSFSVAGSGSLIVSTYNQFSAGTLTVPANATVTQMTGLQIGGPTTSASGTVSTFTGVNVVNPASQSGTLTTLVGVDIAQLTRGGTTNIGFRCAGSMVYTPTVVTVSGNAGTVPVTVSHAKCTASSASATTITLATTNAVDGQELLVRYFDSTAASQTVTFTNSETGKAGAPPASLGSTTIPSTYRFIFNSGTSKWTYTGN